MSDLLKFLSVIFNIITKNITFRARARITCDLLIETIIKLSYRLFRRIYTRRVKIYNTFVVGA